MIPLTERIRVSLAQPLYANMALSMGRLTKLAWRTRLTLSFLDFVLKYSAAHGPTATVKWLKACLVAIQKELGQDRLVSLSSLSPALAYSRMASGLPRIIPSSDRRKMRKGDVHVIRFWTGLFNLYRVLKVPGELKLQTITTPFSGSLIGFGEIVHYLMEANLLGFDRLTEFKDTRSASLIPVLPVMSRSASPSNKVAALGLLTDINYLNRQLPDLWQEILYYLHSVGTSAHSEFVKQLENG